MNETTTALVPAAAAYAANGGTAWSGLVTRLIANGA